MYEEELGTDWDSLDREAALRRAFALGVQAAFGEENVAEYERVCNEAGSTYSRSIVELAYREGKRKASGLKADAADAGIAEAWSELVEETAEHSPGGGDDSPDRTRPTDLPSAVRRAGRSTTPDDGRDRLRFPEFLRR